MGLRIKDPSLTCDCGFGCRCSRTMVAHTPSVVRLGHVPGWLGLRIQRRLRVPRWVPGGWSRLSWALSEMGPGTSGWIDHAGSAIVQGKVTFCSEPYGLSKQWSIDGLLRFCDRLDLEFSIEAGSHWYPMACCRVLIWPPEGEGIAPATKAEREAKLAAATTTNPH